MKQIVLMVVMSALLVGLAWANPGPGVIPEMQECMQSHGSQEQYTAVLKKYCDPGIIRQAMGLLVIKDPYVVKTEKRGPVITYTVEGRTVGTSSEIPSDVLQVYQVRWKNARMVSLEFLGPKKAMGKP